jgi:hypothetical protein
LGSKSAHSRQAAKRELNHQYRLGNSSQQNSGTGKNTMRRTAMFPKLSLAIAKITCQRSRLDFIRGTQGDGRACVGGRWRLKNGAQRHFSTAT